MRDPEFLAAIRRERAMMRNIPKTTLSMTGSKQSSTGTIGRHSTRLDRRRQMPYPCNAADQKTKKRAGPP
jgi:hypothetical protein